MQFLITEKRKKIILALVFALAIFLIVFDFSDTPKVWVDEGVFTEVARNIAWHGKIGLQTAPNQFFPMKALLSTGYPVVFPVALSISLFGTGVAQARLPMIAYMLLLAVFFYLFSEKKYGFYSAVASVLLLLSFSPFYGNGRPVQGEVPGLAFIALGAWLMLLWEKSDFKNWRLALAAGVAFGLAAATKPIYLFGLGGAFAVTILFWFRTIKPKIMIGIFAGGFFIPLLIQIFIQFRSIEALSNIVPTYLLLAGNHGSELSLSATVAQNISRFFTESTPMVFIACVAVIVYSFFLRSRLILRDKMPESLEKRISISESVILGFIILNWLAYLMGTGWYRYFFPAHALAYLLLPFALWNLAKNIRPATFKKALIALPFLLAGLQMYHLIFLSDTSLTAKRTRNAELSAVIGNIDPLQKVLFYNSVEAVVFYRGAQYSEYLSMGDFLIAGDKNIFSDPYFDVIISGEEFSDEVFPCHEKKTANRYFVYERLEGCEE